MKKLVLIMMIAITGLSGCVNDPNSPQQYIDQNLRAKLFQDCLHNLPLGPQVTHYNDWDEVVKACDTTSYYQATVTVTPLVAAKNPHFTIKY